MPWVKSKDGISVSTPSKASKGKPGGSPRACSLSFLANLIRVDLYKPMQGWYAAGVHGRRAGRGRCRGGLKDFRGDSRVRSRSGGSGLPAAFAAVLGWMVFRIVHFPPFAEFLIATEAEMNKVSWTSKDDLIRATTVVLTTVVLMAVFLFLVDTLWTFILRLIGVLQFTGGGGLGSTG